MVVQQKLDLIKLFWSNLHVIYRKLDRFMNAIGTCCIVMKGSSFEIMMSKFKPKKFYETDLKL